MTVLALGEAAQGLPACLDPLEAMAALATLAERASLVTLVRLALMVFRDLLVVLVSEGTTVARERRERLSTLT